MSVLRDFLDAHFLHFNSREVVASARGWIEHLEARGEMMVTLAGAMSTARIGKLLAPLIRAGKVHAICCTGANLEEDIFGLLAGDEFEHIPNWRALTAEDEAALFDRGMNRVTDTCIPETIMEHLEERLLAQWARAEAAGESLSPAQHLWAVLETPGLEALFQRGREESWLLAAKECGVPVWTPGWEDSTTGNMFAAAVFRGALKRHDCVWTGTRQMEQLLRWYIERNPVGQGRPATGFFQIGGGIAGDFPICAVPCLVQDLERKDTPLWGYFCQISDAVTSYGGYSGAVPNEKITWGKLAVETPKFMIQSDASIVAPLVFAYVLGG